MERRMTGNCHVRCGAGGKFGDDFKELPIAIRRKITGHEAADVRSWTDSACNRTCSGITVHDDECRLICSQKVSVVGGMQGQLTQEL